MKISHTKLTFWSHLTLGFDCLKTHLSLRCLIQHKLLTIDHRLRTQDVFPYIDVFKFSDVYNVWKMSIFACKHLIKHNKWHLTSNRRDINFFPKSEEVAKKRHFLFWFLSTICSHVRRFWGVGIKQQMCKLVVVFVFGSF